MSTHDDVEAGSEGGALQVAMPRAARPLPPLLEGPQDLPEVARLLKEMDAYFEKCGVLDRATAADVTLLPGAPADRRYSIPDRRYWENMVCILRLLKETGLGALNLRGYRPTWYNQARKGSANSTHQWFSALDIRRSGDTSMREIHQAAKWLWDNRSAEHKMGIGVYANNIHIDARRPRVRGRWGSRKHLLS